MQIYVSSYTQKKFWELTKNNPRLDEKIDQKLELFLDNPTHPSLHFHKLTGKRLKVWSISITEDIRLLLQYIQGGILVVDLGSHDDVY